MNSTTKRDFAILNRQTEVVLQTIVNDLQDDCNQKLLITPGTLLRVIDYSNNKKNAIVQILNYGESNFILDNLYKCPTNNIRIIQDNLWPYLISIHDPEDRVQLTENAERTREILHLHISDIVSVSGEPFRKHFSYVCIVRYIGLVPEMGPGYYIGLELLDLDHGYSPQFADIPYVSNYMSCDPTLSLILSANWISRNTEDKGKKFSPTELFCGTLDRAKSALGLSRRQSSKNVQGRKSPDKKRSLNNYNRESNSSSIATLLNSDGSDKNAEGACVMEKKVLSKHFSSTSSSSSCASVKRDKATNTSFGQRQEQTGENGIVNKAGEKQKNDRTLQNENLISLDNDDYARYLENYERGVERQHDTDKPHIPVSILKQPKGKKKASIAGVKPNTIMSLEDRDIVVIDKADIKESTMNESTVIVVDNPRTQKEVDLADLLGTNWPNSAGDAAMVLNSEAGKNSSASGHVSSSSNSSVSSFTVRSERNRSANPISHLISTKSLERRQKEINKIQNDHQETVNLPEKKIKNVDRSEPIYDNANIPTPQLVPIGSAEEEVIVPSPLSEIPGTNLGVGSMVEVSTDVCEDLYGVIRWIGCPQSSKNVMVGVELEDEPGDRPLTLTDGTHNGVRLFKCPTSRALFVHPNQCSNDRRFTDIEVPQAACKSIKAQDSRMFGQVECPPVAGAVAPLKIFNLDELEAICGKFKGIQGHHNSCYLDATLFSMFTFTSVFDSLLFRPPEPEDITHYEEVQQVLREEIVNPLRKNIFVRADKVMKLRQLLERLSSISGLTSEEKDPEEFLNSLLAQIMRADPFLKLSSGQDAFFYQLFVEKDERLSFPSVQQLFEQSFLASDIKLKEVPSCLIIQMPRFGKNFKMYPRILPSQVLDVTDIIEDSPRQCSVCGKLAEYECRECFGILQCGVGLESTAFCKKCLETVHSHAKRANHMPKEIFVPQDFKIMAEHLTVPRLFMELFAVVCIETSHYVAFVKAGSGLDAPWCFFDSMADRKGEQNGYNIPEMVSVPDLPQWLSEEGARVINEAASNDKMLPEHAKRLLCDAYMCMYQSTDVMMYR